MTTRPSEDSSVTLDLRAWRACRSMAHMSIPQTVGATPISVDAQLGARVHQLMFLRRLSQTAMAPKMGLTQGNLSRKLRGEVAWYARDIATAARVLGVTPNDLMEWAPRGSNPEPTVSTSSQVSGDLIDLAREREQRRAS